MVWKLIGGAVSVVVGVCTIAHGAEFDVAASYSARQSTILYDTGEKSDNDIVRVTTGLSWDAADGRMRGALELGAINEDFSGSYPWVRGGELAFARKVGNQRYGIGGRVRSAETLSTTGEIIYAIEHFGSAIDWRGLFGGQFIQDADKVQGRSGNSVFAQGDATYFPSSNLALTAGVLADGDGEAWTVGTEYRFAGSRLSLFVDWGHALNSYRGLDQYNDLTGGIRFVPRSKSLRSYRQSNISRMMQRYLEVQ